MKGTIKNTSEPIYTDYVRPSRLIQQRIESKKPNLRKAKVLDGDNPSRTLRFLALLFIVTGKLLLLPPTIAPI